MHNQSKVVLPGWIFTQAKDESELKQLVLKYMTRYPGYTVKSVKGRIAICEIHR